MNYVDGVDPKVAQNAPSAISRDVPHVADPADRFADQMATFDRMREINMLEQRRSAEERTRHRMLDEGMEP